MSTPMPPPDADPAMKGVVGIQNMGNTCYCNTTLQLLRACPEWTVYCLTETAPPRPENPNYRIFVAYQEILRSLWSAYLPAYVRPLGFLHEVCQAVKGTPYEMFGMPIQNDSHEYLVYLLDHFHEALRQEVPYEEIPLTPSMTSTEAMRARAVNGWNRFVSKNKSVVVDLFFGMMRKTIQCTVCQQCNYQWEVFNSMKVPCEGATFMEWILREITERTELADYQCDVCKEKRRAVLSSHLWKLPPHLFITLHRFRFDGQKIMTPCPYDGTPILFRDGYAPESDDPMRHRLYELRGVSDHHGTHMGGHYSAQFKHPLTGQWWMIDDERAQSMEQPRFTASNYIFYFRHT